MESGRHVDRLGSEIRGGFVQIHVHLENTFVSLISRQFQCCYHIHAEKTHIL